MFASQPCIWNEETELIIHIIHKCHQKADHLSYHLDKSGEV